MPDPTEVYIVTSGSYSDYGIRRVFLNRAEADQYVTTMNATAGHAYYEYDVETWPIGRPLEDDDAGRYAYEWTPNGGFQDEFGWDYDVPDGAKSHVIEAGPERVVVAGSSDEQVRKVIYDEVTRIKAEQAGIA